MQEVHSNPVDRIQWTRTIPIPRSWSGCSARTSRGSARPPTGRIFQTARGGILQDSGYNEVWTEARKTALTPASSAPRSPAALTTCATPASRCG